MDYLGLFCLGAFAGTIATFGISRAVSLKDWQTIVTFSLPAVFSGAVVIVSDRFSNSAAFGSYPAGLVTALVWAYIPNAARRVQQEHGVAFFIGVAHFATSFAISIALSAIAAIPAFLHIRAEMDVDRCTRMLLLLDKQMENERAKQQTAARGWRTE